MLSGCPDLPDGCGGPDDPDDDIADPGETWEPDDYPLILSPPHIRAPVFECAERIAVESLLENASVRVFDEDDVPIGAGTADRLGIARISLEYPLEAGDVIYAVQYVNDEESPPSDLRVVQTYGFDALPKPRLAADSYECGRITVARGLIPGLRLTIEQDDPGNAIGDAVPVPTHTSELQQPVAHDPLPYPAQVRAQQVHCPDARPSLIGPPSEWHDVRPAPSPMPKLEIQDEDIVAGMDPVYVDGAHVGAWLSFDQPGTGAHGWRYAIRENGAPINVHEDIQEGYSVEFRQELCEESAPTVIDPLPPIVLGDVGPPEVVDPICPGTSAVLVKTTFPQARIVVYHNDEVVRLVDANSSGTLITLYGLNIQDGDELRFHQLFEDPDNLGDIQSEPAIVTVQESDTFEIRGAEEYEDQNTGHTIEGFVRETSRGPEFVLRCCADCREPDHRGQCYVDGEDGLEPRKARIEILQDDVVVDDLWLHEEYPGYFSGRWDWFMEQGATDPWPPAPSLEYEAVVNGSPCDVTLSESFQVLIGEPDFDDDTRPELARLTLSDPEGSELTVDQDSLNSQKFEVTPGVEIDVDALGFDPEGLFRIQLDESGNDKLNPPDDKESDPDVVPIPPKLSLQTTLDAFDPYEESALQLRAYNYNAANGMTLTPMVEIVGAHPEPIITNINPSNAFPDDETITIEGLHLHYPSLETTIHFELDPDCDSSSITAEYEVQDTDGWPMAIDDIAIPSEFEGKFGTVEVTVETVNSDDPADSQMSNVATFELIRPEPVLNDVSPVSFYSHMTLVLTGEHLRYPSLETTVHFKLERPGEPPIEATYSVDSDGSPTEIEISEIPTELHETHGPVEVWVVTDDSCSERKSNRLLFELRDREQGEFQEFGIEDFSISTSDLGCSSANAEPGAITNIWFTDGPISGQHQFAAIIESENNVEQIPFSTVTVPVGDDEAVHLGGVVVGENCRAVAVLSQRLDEDWPPRFHLHLRYFSPWDIVASDDYDRTDVYLEDGSYVPRAFGLFFSADETVAVLGNITHQGTSPIPVQGWMSDFLSGDDSTSLFHGCNTDQLCEPEVSIDDNLVELRYKLDESQYNPIFEVELK